MLLYINSDFEPSGIERITKGSLDPDKLEITKDFQKFNASSQSKKWARIYLDLGLKWPKLNNSTDTYSFIGDTHHLPGLLLGVIRYLCQYPWMKVYFYGKPTHFRFARLYGISANPTPIDIYLIEAFAQSKALNKSVSQKQHLASICNTVNDHQYKRGRFLRESSSMIDSSHSFLSKKDYLHYLSKSTFYYILSNCLQLNPQLFFALASNAVPIVNGIPDVYYEIYPCLYNIPHSSKIVNANNFIFTENQMKSIQQTTRSNLESLYNSSKGELFWADNFRDATIDYKGLNSDDICLVNKHLCFVDSRNALIFVHEICQQIIKYTYEDLIFEFYGAPSHVNYFLFQDLNCFNIKSNKVEICSHRFEDMSNISFHDMKGLQTNTVLLNKSISQVISIYQNYAESKLAVSFI